MLLRGRDSPAGVTITLRNKKLKKYDMYIYMDALKQPNISISSPGWISEDVAQFAVPVGIIQSSSHELSTLHIKIISFFDRLQKVNVGTQSKSNIADYYAPDFDYVGSVGDQRSLEVEAANVVDFDVPINFSPIIDTLVTFECQVDNYQQQLSVVDFYFDGWGINGGTVDFTMEFTQPSIRAESATNVISQPSIRAESATNVISQPSIRAESALTTTIPLTNRGEGNLPLIVPLMVRGEGNLPLIMPLTNREESDLTATILLTNRSESASNVTSQPSIRAESALTTTTPLTNHGESVLSLIIHPSVRFEDAPPLIMQPNGRFENAPSLIIPPNGRFEDTLPLIMQPNVRFESALTTTIPLTNRGESTLSLIMQPSIRAESALTTIIPLTNRGGSTLSLVIPPNGRVENTQPLITQPTIRSENAPPFIIPPNGRVENAPTASKLMYSGYEFHPISEIVLENVYTKRSTFGVHQRNDQEEQRSVESPNKNAFSITKDFAYKDDYVDVVIITHDSMYERLHEDEIYDVYKSIFNEYVTILEPKVIKQNPYNHLAFATSLITGINKAHTEPITHSSIGVRYQEEYRVYKNYLNASAFINYTDIEGIRAYNHAVGVSAIRIKDVNPDRLPIIGIRKETIIDERKSKHLDVNYNRYLYSPDFYRPFVLHLTTIGNAKKRSLKQSFILSYKQEPRKSIRILFAKYNEKKYKFIVGVKRYYNKLLKMKFSPIERDKVFKFLYVSLPNKKCVPFNIAKLKGSSRFKSMVLGLLYNYSFRMNHLPTEKLHPHQTVTIQIEKSDYFRQTIAREMEKSDLFGQVVTRKIEKSDLFGQTVARRIEKSDLFGQVVTRKIEKSDLFNQIITRKTEKSNQFGQTAVIKLNRKMSNVVEVSFWDKFGLGSGSNGSIWFGYMKATTTNAFRKLSTYLDGPRALRQDYTKAILWIRSKADYYALRGVNVEEALDPIRVLESKINPFNRGVIGPYVESSLQKRFNFGAKHKSLGYYREKEIPMPKFQGISRYKPQSNKIDRTIEVTEYKAFEFFNQQEIPIADRRYKFALDLETSTRLPLSLKRNFADYDPKPYEIPRLEIIRAKGIKMDVVYGMFGETIDYFTKKAISADKYTIDTGVNIQVKQEPDEYDEYGNYRGRGAVHVDIPIKTYALNINEDFMFEYNITYRVRKNWSLERDSDVIQDYRFDGKVNVDEIETRIKRYIQNGWISLNDYDGYITMTESGDIEVHDDIVKEIDLLSEAQQFVSESELMGILSKSLKTIIQEKAEKRRGDT